MKIRLAYFLVVSLLLMFGCSKFRAVETTPPPLLEDGSRSKATMMDASFYGHEFAGRKTASGEIYQPHNLTAAHRTLPFGTILRISSPSTGKSVQVKVNDRGPFVKGRELDLSNAAANALGLKDAGVSKVSVEILERSPS